MKNLTYSTFAQSCVNELLVLQEKFRLDYKFDSFDNWFYNQATGLLTFSKDQEEINFRYLEVGTFSRKANTWKWSWDNETTLNSVKEQISVVREFGESNDFEFLSKGYFESSEEDAWEFTAIAAKLVNGIGVYRPVSDQLLIFMVILQFVDNNTAQNIKEKYVECENHGFSRRAFVCKHLNLETKIGFEEAFETSKNMDLEDDDDLQAWCNECEKVRQKEDGWNDKSMAFADIKVVCEDCYFTMKERNLRKD